MPTPTLFQYLTGLHSLWLAVSNCSTASDFESALLSPDSGICDNAKYYVDYYDPYTASEKDFQPRWKSWTKFSGNDVYPVPHQVREAGDAYWASTTPRQLWGDTPYGRNRMELLEFLIYSFAQDVWDELSNIPIDENECIEQTFYDWDVGTDRKTIWEFFDETLPIGLGKWLESKNA